MASGYPKHADLAATLSSAIRLKLQIMGERVIAQACYNEMNERSEATHCTIEGCVPPRHYAMAQQDRYSG
jgi:hypothetical protein